MGVSSPSVYVALATSVIRFRSPCCQRTASATARPRAKISGKPPISVPVLHLDEDAGRRLDAMEERVVADHGRGRERVRRAAHDERAIGIAIHEREEHL